MIGEKFNRTLRNTSIIFILAFSIMLSAISACSLNTVGINVGKDLSNQEPDPYAKPKVKIKFSYNKAQIGINAEDSIIKFNETNDLPFEVEIVKIPDDRYSETLNMLMSSGEGPDVFEIGSEWIDSYITKKWIHDLKSYLNDDFLKKFPDWVNQYIQPSSSKNELFTLPSGQTTVRLIYNKDLFKQAGLDENKPPVTMGELKEYAYKISYSQKGNKKYGFALNAGDGRKFFEQAMEATSTYSGVNYYNFKEGIYDLTVYDKWFQAIIGMKNEKSLMPGEAILNGGNALTQFAEGNIGMMYANSGAPVFLKNIKRPNSMKFSWGVALPPALDKKSKGMGKSSVIPSVFYCVNSKSLYKDEAVEFWKYLYSEGYLGEMYSRGYIIPVLESVISNPKYTPNVDNLEMFLPTNDDSVYPPVPRVINDWLRYDTYMDILNVEKAPYEILNGETQSMNAEYNAILDNEHASNNSNKNPKFDWRSPLAKKKP